MCPEESGPERSGGSAAAHARLAERGIAHDVVAHPPTYRALDEARVTGSPAGAAAKTIVAVDRDRWWLAVVPASRTLDMHRLREHTGASRHLRLATEAEIALRFTEFDVGATPPLGALIGTSEVVDPLVLGHETIVCSSGDHEHSIRLSPDALLQAADPIVADICSHHEDERRTRFADVPQL